MKKKRQTLKIEKMLFIVIIGLLILLPVVNVYSKALVSETNIEVEKLKNNIEYQENINEALDMKISELTSLDKIQALANELGLTYNNDNIVIVNQK